MAPKMKYRVPISLWLVENSHRTRFFLCSPPKKEERLVLALRKTTITGWVGPTKKNMGVFGVR
ncbi:conserved hypothetical protein [Ricinus communis]|uniref:Uncharacterized protein n=1 Tax=Ricinus communis TaxID=3988 RepID=B9T9Z1_RICCO|nr:conserved hypothetical protein [Ricinus communis]